MCIFSSGKKTSKTAIKRSTNEVRKIIQEQRIADDTGIFSTIIDMLSFEEILDSTERAVLQNLELKNLIEILGENREDQVQLEDSIIAENIVLSEALQFYAEEKNYLEDKVGWSMIEYDNGEKARTALKGVLSEEIES